MEGHAEKTAEIYAGGATFAYGLLVCVVAIGISYIVLRAWPRRHFPRFFAALAGVSTVSAIYILQVRSVGLLWDPY